MGVGAFCIFFSPEREGGGGFELRMEVGRQQLNFFNSLVRALVVVIL